MSSLPPRRCRISERRSCIATAPSPPETLDRARRPPSRRRASTLAAGVSIVVGMHENVDRRLLGGWEQSRRHQAHARRYLARQRLPALAGEGRTLDEIAATIADLERLRPARADRLRARLDDLPPAAS